MTGSGATVVSSSAAIQLLDRRRDHDTVCLAWWWMTSEPSKRMGRHAHINATGGT